jgi:hypothetical protein
VRASALAVSLGLLAQVQGNSFELDWHTLDGGGGVSSGGTFTLVATIGQPDAGRSQGGTFALESGFWGAAIAIQQPGAPALQITPAGANILLSWPTAAKGYTLQFIESFSSPIDWDDVLLIGSETSVTIPATATQRFYRLTR